MFAKNHPIWKIVDHKGLSLTRFADKIGYSYPHVKNVKYGLVNCTAEFRERCARVLDLPESVLFLSADCPTDQSDDQANTVDILSTKVG